ncbi:MAG: TlpA family protein disulfide reductase [Fimbriimonadaceae bacterium]|nr:TlpA family protein disulfide reductase [Fimbriimonadaceae bacterium]
MIKALPLPVALVFLLVGCAPESDLSRAKAALPPEPAMNFEVTGLDGKPLELKSLKGKVVLVDFWATWCGYCNELMPGVEALHKKYGDKGLAVVAVTKEDPALVKKFVATMGYKLPFYLDTNGEAHSFYEVAGYPSLLIVDREGFVTQRLQGAHPIADIEGYLKEAGL